METFLIFSIFSTFMKLSAFQEYLRRQHLGGAFFVHPDPTLLYFTQQPLSYGLLLVTPRDASLYITKLDQPRNSLGIMVKPLVKDWSKQLSSLKPKVMGINKTSLTVSWLEKLKKIWPTARFVDVSETLQELRQQKTPEEIQKITTACTLTTNSFTALLKELPKRTLHTEQDVALFLEKHVVQQGGEWAFPPIVAMGKNAAVPHHATSTQLLKRGFLLLDFGAKYQNYCADMTRVVFLGTPTAEEKKYYQLLLDAQQGASAAVQEDTSFHQLETIARKKLGKYAKNFTHSLGHGIGIEVHEAPVFSDKKQNVRRKVVFTIEPGIYFPGKFGLRIEDTLLFDGKTRILTKATKELVVVPVP